MQPGTLVAEKYRVERVIGRGGMGLVVEATHLQLEVKVALKFLDEHMASDAAAVARFTREARACAQLKGEHICRVTDFGVEGKRPYIVMELLTGTDLAKLSKMRTLDVPTAAMFIKQAATGLAEAHAMKIIHRDLKPGNLFLTRRPNGSPLIKILDFGVATAPIGDKGIALTATSTAVGSPGFMSPEQLRSSKTVDGRSDIWSLGIILFKLVTGKLPFEANSFAEFALAISSAPTPPLPNAPPEFAAVVMCCLEKDPAKRYPDVNALADALTPFAAQARSSAPIMQGFGDTGPVPLEEPQPAQAKAPVEHATRLGTRARSEPGAVKEPRAAIPPAATPKQVPKTLLGTASPTVPEQPRVRAAPSPSQAPYGIETVGTLTPSSNPQLTAAGSIVANMARTMVGELAPGTLVGEYKIEQKIGQGGMGVVYSAIHPLIGKKAAIKVIGADLGTDPVVVQRFVQEARSVNQIGHPNIVDVFAFGKLPDGRNYFVMEYLQGESLRAKLTRMYLPLAEAVQILDEIAGALEAAHEKQIVHRDLKPDNVFLSSVRGNVILVKLLDFGIAKLTLGEGTGIAKTNTGEMIGTPAYLSPEQARGKNVDYRTDIYALGCMMYEMVTGRLPFIAESSMDIVLMHISAQPLPPSQWVPDLPPQIETMILRMMDKDPDRRPSLAELRTLFAELVASGMVPIEPGSGATFRSELARGASSARHGMLGGKTPSPENKTPTPEAKTPQPPVLPLPAPTTTTGGRRRNTSPSDAPTGIAFTPGPQTLTPSDQAHTKVRAAVKPKSKRGLLIAVVVLAMSIPAVAIVLATVNKSEQAAAAAPADAAVAQITPAVPADAGAADAAAAAVASDAAVEVTRAIEIKTNVANVEIAVDGAVVPVARGIAKLQLADGPHQLVAKASGRETLERTIEVSATTSTIELKLERIRRAGSTQSSSGQGSASATGSAAKPPEQGSSYSRDGQIDPFK